MAITGIPIISGFNLDNNQPIDKRSGPYDSVVDALAGLTSTKRAIGLIVYVADNAVRDPAGNLVSCSNLSSYIFEKGLTDADLIPYNSGITDAPSDGKLYGRKDGSWTDVADSHYTETETDNLLGGKEDSLGNPTLNDQILSSKSDGTRIWITQPETAKWGGITGTLTDQSDLKAALDDKSDIGHKHDSDYLGINATATDSDMLGGHPSSDYASASAVALKEDKLGNPTANGQVLSSTSSGDRAWVNFPTVAIDWGDIGGTLSSQLDLKAALDDKSELGHNHDLSYLGINDAASDSNRLGGVPAADYSRTGHNHDTEYFKKTEFINSSSGVSDAGKPIVLDGSGKINPDMVDVSTFHYIAPFTPTAGTEYPDTTGQSYGSFWVVQNLASPYTFTTGDLDSQTVDNGDYMVWADSGWSIIDSGIDASVYYKLDGSVAITGDFAGGGKKITNIADGTNDTDGVSKLQMENNIVMPTDGVEVTTNVGGFKAGDIITGDKSTKELLNQILFPYVPSSLSSISITPGSNAEVGKLVALSAANISWVNDSEDHVPYHITIIGTGFTGEQTVPSGSTSASIATTGTVMRTTVGYNTWTFEAKDKNNVALASKTDRIYWYFPIFHGMNPTDLTSNETILYTKLDKEMTGKESKSYLLNGDTEHIYFAYHASFGNLAQIKDGSGFVQDFADWDIITMNIQSSGLDDNWTESYLVYKSKAKVSVVNQTYQFIF
jgi:hypothetical protein